MLEKLKRTGRKHIKKDDSDLFKLGWKCYEQTTSHLLQIALSLTSGWRNGLILTNLVDCCKTSLILKNAKRGIQTLLGSQEELDV